MFTAETNQPSHEQAGRKEWRGGIYLVSGSRRLTGEAPSPTVLTTGDAVSEEIVSVVAIGRLGDGSSINETVAFIQVSKDTYGRTSEK